MIYDKLFDWQKKIIDNFENRKSWAIYLDVGLGKSPVSLAFAERHKSNKIIIISINAKATETEQINGSFLWWIKNHFDQPFNFYNKKSKTLPTSNTTNDVFIINYESLYNRDKVDKRTPLKLRDCVANFVESCKDSNVTIIIDESHKCKDYSAIQTKAILLLQKQLNTIANDVYTYLLTGTPFTQGFIDTWCQLKILGCPMTKTEFIEKYCIRGHIRGLVDWMQPIVAYKNVDDLYNLIHKYAITIKSTDVIKLPEVIFDKIVLTMSEEMKFYLSPKYMAYKVLKRCSDKNIGLDLEMWRVPDDLSHKMPNPFYRNIAYPDTTWAGDTIAGNYLRTRELSIGFQGNEEKAEWFDRARLDRLEKFLTDNEDNYIIFYNFTPELTEIYSICDKLGYKIDVYAGGNLKSETYYNEYANMSEGEQMVNKKRVLIANWASGGTGKNYQAYNKTIIFSLPTYCFWQQGLGRTSRIGQKHTTIYYIFMQNNFLDKAMLEAINNGVEYNNDMFDADLKKQEILGEKEDVL